jgi:CrcB protein
MMSTFTPLHWVALAVLGSAGVLTRVAVIQLGFLNRPMLLAGMNIAGAFLIGVVWKWGEMRWNSPLVVGIAAGYLGGLTTFSSYALDIYFFAIRGHWGAAIAYGLLSPLLALLALILGVTLTGLFFR